MWEEEALQKGRYQSGGWQMPALFIKQYRERRLSEMRRTNAEAGASQLGGRLSSEEDPFFLSAKSVFINVELTTQGDVLQFIGKAAYRLGATTDPCLLETELRKREETLSTGLMGGFAIPHAKCDLVAYPVIIYIRTKQPVAWTMLEGNEAQNFFAMLVPSDGAAEKHLKMLSRISVCLLEKEFRQQVSSIATAPDMVVYLKQRFKFD